MTIIDTIILNKIEISFFKYYNNIVNHSYTKK